MISRRYEFNLQELKDLAKGLNMNPVSLEEIYNSLRIISIINASAYKGYGALSDAQIEINNFVYVLKNESLPYLFNLASEMGGDTGYKGGILYYRHTNGIQLSYHYDNFNNIKDIKFTNNNPEWDHIRFSWEYDDYTSYQIEVEKYWRRYNIASDIYHKYLEELFKNILEVLSSGPRRKSFGIKENIAYLRGNKKTVVLSPNCFDCGINEWELPSSLYVLFGVSVGKGEGFLFDLVAGEMGFNTYYQLNGKLKEEIKKATEAAL
jgi:hypothetical protein